MRALLLGNGEPPPKELLLGEAARADFVVCADGAAGWALDNGVVPSVIVGDMDSISAESLNELRRLNVPAERHPPEKDDTDMQLAAEYALNRGAKEMILLGATGARLDHTLGNLQVLAFLRSKGVDAAIIDKYCETRVLWDEQKRVQGTAGTAFSLVPFGENVIINRLCGVKYPLEGHHLTLTRPLGISNVFIKDEFLIDVTGGVLMMLVL